LNTNSTEARLKNLAESEPNLLIAMSKKPGRSVIALRRRQRFARSKAGEQDAEKYQAR
jgi:hypothetical protein